MHVVVLLKEAPDTFGERLLDLETGLAVRTPDTSVVDEPSARALEAALTIAEHHTGCTVTVVAMGPPSATSTLRKGLSMGAHAATLISDPLLSGADASLTAQALATLLQRIDHDLVLAGDASTDGSGGVVPAMMAELLGHPGMTALDTLDIADGVATGVRTIGDDTHTLSAALPVVASVTERFPEPRLPGIRAMMAAKKVEISTVTAADLGIEAARVVHDPRSIMTEIRSAPAREAGVRDTDVGGAGVRLAEFLASRGFGLDGTP